VWTSGCRDRDADPDPAAEYLYTHSDYYVLDPRRDSGRVTSEGQGYALLRAAWEHDELAFRRIAEWTRTHLQRPDGLHSWLWTPEDGGRVVDPNTATDGDMEIAWALLLGSQIFEDEALWERGAEIVRAVGAHAMLELPGTSGSSGTPAAPAPARFPAAGNWAVEERIANLSYFLPYAHPWFALADPEGGWDAITDVGYDLIGRWMADPAHRLPPAFFRLDEDGAPHPLPASTELEIDFSFDAIRLFWRVEADCRLHGRPRACADPIGVPEALAVLVDSTGIASRYTPAGARLTPDQSTTFYAALLSTARRHAPRVAEEVLVPRLDPTALDLLLTARDRYYDHNWVWFGLALDRGIIEARTPRPPEG
jgi:hypothetical protein